MTSGPGGSSGLKRISALRSKKGYTVSSENELTENASGTKNASPSLDGVRSSVGNNISTSRLSGLGQGQGSHLAGISTSPASSNQNTTSQRICSKKQGRGPTTGTMLEKEVKKNGKYKISFLPGETIPMKYETQLSSGIGIIVRAHAEIKGVSRWKEVPDINKELCYARLFTWFEIEDWSIERVKKIIDDKFQVAYTRWRNTLHDAYKKLKDEGIDPIDVCPRPDLTMEKWEAACDFIKDENYQERSVTNSNNRDKNKLNHTTGRTPILSRFKRMEKKSEIELFRETRVSKKKGGEFLNEAAKSLYDEMIEKKRKSMEQDGEPLSEAEIVKSLLGHKSGYIKGMGHGVEVTGGSSSNVVAGADLKEKLIELENAQEKISDFTNAYEDQKIALEVCKEQYSEKINTLEVQHSKKINTLGSQMLKMQHFLEKIPGIPPNLFHD